MNLKKQFMEGLITQNPVLVQVLGMCSTMAITTSFFNGLGMGVAVTVILTLSNVIISAIRKIVPDKIRIAMFIVVIAGFVTCVDLLIQAFVPALAESLGVFIPLIVVNCIILGRAESFSYKNGIAASFFDGIFQGIGYTVVLMVMCIIREFLGTGTFGGGLLNGGAGIRILPEQFPIGVLTLLSFPGRVQEGGYRRGHGHRRDVRHGPCLRGVLCSQRAGADSVGPGVHADGGLHPGHRRPGAVH